MPPGSDGVPRVRLSGLWPASPHVPHNQSVTASKPTVRPFSHTNIHRPPVNHSASYSSLLSIYTLLTLNHHGSSLSKGNLNTNPELSERKLWSHCRALINNHSLFTLTTLKLRLGETLFLPTAGCPDQPPFSQSRCKLTAPSNAMLRRCS